MLRTTKETTSNAIAKMKAMRAHAYAFAELMLEYAAADQAPDKTSCWTAFSGLLDDAAIKSHDWAKKEKKPSASSSAVYNIAEFDTVTGSGTMQSPAPNVAYRLTVAKVKASELPIDYEPLGPVEPIKAAFKGKGPAKRKFEAIKNNKDEEDMDDGSDMDDDDGGSS